MSSDWGTRTGWFTCWFAFQVMTTGRGSLHDEKPRKLFKESHSFRLLPVAAQGSTFWLLKPSCLEKFSWGKASGESTSAALAAPMNLPCRVSSRAGSLGKCRELPSNHPAGPCLRMCGLPKRWHFERVTTWAGSLTLQGIASQRPIRDICNLQPAAADFCR